MTVRQVEALLRSSHPEPTAMVTLLLAALAATVGHGPAGVALVGAAVLTGQLSIGWLNDALDAGRDAAVGRVDKPVVSGAVTATRVRTAALVAGAVCVPLSLALGPLAGAAHLVAVAAGWVYDLRLKSTAASVVPYVVCFGLLPAVVVLALPGAPVPPWWLVAGGALLGAGAHFANVLPDLDDDAATGVRGLPHRLGAAGSRAAAAVLMLAATTVLAAGAPVPAAVAVGAPLLAGLVLVVGFLRGRRPGSRAPFQAVLVAAAVAVAMLLTAGPALVPA